MSVLTQRPRIINQCRRAFSTSSRRSVSLQWDKNNPEALADALPPYPYETPRWYRQSRLGLYGGQSIRFGNNVSGPFDIKTRRAWRPNIFTRKVFSKSLNRTVQIRVSTRVLRTMDKLGGLDEYLLGEKTARIKELGESGWWLRWAIMQTPAIKKRFAQERRELGLPELQDDAPASALEAGEDAIVTETTPEAAAEFVAQADTEPVQMDDTFQVDASPDLPPLKFRVGPGKHLMLTSTGWHRTRPDPARMENKIKDRIAELRYANYVDARTRSFEQALDEEASAIQGEGHLDTGLNAEERKRMIKNARKAFRSELQERLDSIYENRMAAKVERAELRRAEKKARKAADAAALGDAQDAGRSVNV